ncbi:glutamyl-tRNA reductase [Lachnospiraceae bacterium]|nr:glutamyl-tRNA reductase [Lachnospiraceae bacterium]
MNLKMTGIDFTTAGIDIRQRFSFTSKAMAAAIAQIRQKQEIRGCVLLSTCNRMELWLSLEEGAEFAIADFLCRLKGLSCEEYQEYFVVREGAEAVKHLFYLSAGMKSQIVGEDQILTQVKEALAFAREQEGADRLLEVLFRMAVTAGKQVKANVVMDKANFSAAHRALEFLKEQGNVLTEKICLVIGNGEMGKLTAQALMEEGADVTVTVRQYRSGIVKIPQGAKRIDYGERYRYIPKCDLVVSATASPNLTITREGLDACLRQRDAYFQEQIFLDLAVPRDMETSIAERQGVVYYDMDSLPFEAQSVEMRRQYEKAQNLLDRAIQKFLEWQECRDLVPRIQQIGADAGRELAWRMEKTLQHLNLSKTDLANLQKQLEHTTGKVVDKLLFELRNQAEPETLQKTVEVFEQVYRDSYGG